MKKRLNYAVAVAMVFVYYSPVKSFAIDTNTNTIIKNETATTDPNDLFNFKETLKKAEAGDAGAQGMLGIMYCNGRGVPQDYKEAVKWYTRAAEQGLAEAQFNLGVMYTKGQGVSEDYKEAFKWYTQAAEQGNVTAQSNLGVMYANGQGVPQDYKEAVKWYTRAAEQGNVKAQSNLGVMYSDGQGVPQDYKEAVKWYTRAAEQGNVTAQFNLGNTYYTGQGVPQDYKEAVKWYTRAAEQGLAEAQFNLGNTYLTDQGVPQDYKEAFKWYTQAAEQGYSGAQFNLGVMYVKGQGVPEDYVEAYKWFNLAAAQGHELSVESRDILRQTMSPAQIAEAQRLSREFKPKKQEPGPKDAQHPAEAKIRGNGTGFVITTDGYVLTTYHAVQEAVLVKVWASKGLFPARVVRVDKRCAEKACLNSSYSIHCLRHTYACFLLKASDWNLRLVQKQLGHARISTTQVYADVMMPDVKKALDRLYI